MVLEVLLLASKVFVEMQVRCGRIDGMISFVIIVIAFTKVKSICTLMKLGPLLRIVCIITNKYLEFSLGSFYWDEFVNLFCLDIFEHS